MGKKRTESMAFIYSPVAGRLVNSVLPRDGVWQGLLDGSLCF